MGKEMCAQMEVLKKIRKAGKMNGYAVELAEAQAEDFVTFRREFKEAMKSITETQIKQGAQLDLIVKYINSPAEQERKDGIIWNEIRKAIKSWKGWALIIFFFTAVALAGDKVLQILGWLPTGA